DTAWELALKLILKGVVREHVLHGQGVLGRGHPIHVGDVLVLGEFGGNHEEPLRRSAGARTGDVVAPARQFQVQKRDRHRVDMRSIAGNPHTPRRYETAHGGAQLLPESGSRAIAPRYWK